jgi:hypothetical protein
MKGTPRGARSARQNSRVSRFVVRGIGPVPEYAFLWNWSIQARAVDLSEQTR